MKHIIKDHQTGIVSIICDECLRKAHRERVILFAYIAPLDEYANCEHTKGEQS